MLHHYPLRRANYHSVANTHHINTIHFLLDYVFSSRTSFRTCTHSVGITRNCLIAVLSFIYTPHRIYAFIKWRPSLCTSSITVTEHIHTAFVWGVYRIVTLQKSDPLNWDVNSKSSQNSKLLPSTCSLRGLLEPSHFISPSAYYPFQIYLNFIKISARRMCEHLQLILRLQTVKTWNYLTFFRTGFNGRCDLLLRRSTFSSIRPGNFLHISVSISCSKATQHYAVI